MKNKSGKKSYQAREYRHLRKRKSIFRNKYFWFVVLAILLVAGFFYFLVFSPVFQLNKVIVKGTSFINASELESFVNEQANKNIIFFPTKSIIVFSVQKTERLASERFLPIESLEIRRIFFNKLAVNVIERKSEAVFCSINNCYLIDKKGVIFQTTEKESVSPNRAIIVSDGENNLGDIAVSDENLGFITEVFKLLKQRDILVSEFKVSQSEKIEAKIAENELTIYFNSQKSAEQQMQDLILVLEDQNSPDNESGRAQEYIDLRFDKIFIK